MSKILIKSNENHIDIILKTRFDALYTAPDSGPQYVDDTRTVCVGETKADAVILYVTNYTNDGTQYVEKIYLQPETIRIIQSAIMDCQNIRTGVIADELPF